jgi:hypothetical protein
MFHSNDNMLRFKIYELMNDIHNKQNEIENLKSANKSKEDTYKEMITYLQKVNLSLLETIIENNEIGKKNIHRG